jgi:hypothetical protein
MLLFDCCVCLLLYHRYSSIAHDVPAVIYGDEQRV